MTSSQANSPTKAAWFNCQAGVAGDMTLAALVDAGADPQVVGHTIAGLGVDGYALTFERVQRCGVGATWANVVVHQHGDAHEHPHRPVSEIYQLLDNADIPGRVRQRATSVFRQLAEVEGAIHGVAPADIELHEVGALDAIVDVVGVCAALESLDIDELWCSPISVGTGSVTSAHGTIPNPAPATIALLAKAGAPTVGIDTTLEVTTPTGAALMTALAEGFGAAPAMAASSVGYGAGTADVPERANIVQVIVGSRAASEESSDGTDVVLLEANVDDVTGEVLAHAVSKLLRAGAHDAWITPIVMKKGRPAHTVSALCDPSAIDRIRLTLVSETGTLGARASSIKRWPQRRTVTSVDIDGHRIGVKVSDNRLKVEFDDAAKAAEALGLPVRIVLDRATAAASSEPTAKTNSAASDPTP
ncbi:MAG: nickel pincer cofactor biosynthesis protein LarC [Actinobacteria bacterium]|nr:nickel pincer cofactor biosynthesis protein LarC [Actinomycetota bacterium]